MQSNRFHYDIFLQVCHCTLFSIAHLSYWCPYALCPILAGSFPSHVVPPSAFFSFESNFALFYFKETTISAPQHPCRGQKATYRSQISSPLPLGPSNGSQVISLCGRHLHWLSNLTGLPPFSRDICSIAFSFPLPSHNPTPSFKTFIHTYIYVHVCKHVILISMLCIRENTL